MSLVDKARDVQEQHRPASVTPKEKFKHPTGYEPGIDTESGKITGRFNEPLTDDGALLKSFDRLLKEWGFDPEHFTVDLDRINFRTWDAHYGIHRPPERFYYYKADIVRRRPVAELDDLVSRIRRKKPLKVSRALSGPNTFAILNADWQLGKKDGQGTEFTIEAVMNSIPLIKKRYQTLRAQGYEFGDLLIANLGDLVEGCKGHYPMQTFNVELSRREQVRLGRELLTEQIMAFADDFDRVLIAAVAGNHGENRNDDGKSFTNLGDNDDVALVEQVAEAFDLAAKVSSRFEHVRFAIPENELSMVLDVSGTIVGLTHGHVANARRAVGRNLSHTKVWDWWQGQAFGNQPVSDVDLLISGHFHYFSMFEQAGRTALQVPALEDRSEWFTATHGMAATAAVMTMVIGGGRWDAIDITPAQAIVDSAKKAG